MGFIDKVVSPKGVLELLYRKIPVYLSYVSDISPKWVEYRGSLFGECLHLIEKHRSCATVNISIHTAGQVDDTVGFRDSHEWCAL